MFEDSVAHSSETEAEPTIEKKHDTIAIDRALGQWEDALRARAAERAITATQFSQIVDRIRSWLTKEQSTHEQEKALERSIADIRDIITHGSGTHIEEKVEPLFAHIKKQYEQSVGLANESREALPSPEEDKEEICSITISGLAKQRRASEIGPHKLGKFGQDVIRANRKNGTLIVADGVSTFPDSFTTARVASLAAERIFAEIPKTLRSLNAIQQWVASRIPDIVHSLDTTTENGATTLLASKYLPEFDALITIDIGDCQYTLMAGNTVVPIQARGKHTNTPPTIARVHGKSKLTSHTTSHLDRVRVIDLSQVRNTYPYQKIRLIHATDGLENNTGKSIEELATELLDKESSQFQYQKDDIVCGIMVVPDIEHIDEAMAAK